MAEFKYAGSISHGTMRSEDLIPPFLSVLKDLNKDSYAEFVNLSFIAGDPSNLSNYADEYLDELTEQLFDKLNALAPEGYYFGASEGNGSDYGFWETWDDEEQEEEYEAGKYEEEAE